MVMRRSQRFADLFLNRAWGSTSGVCALHLRKVPAPLSEAVPRNINATFSSEEAIELYRGGN